MAWNPHGGCFPILWVWNVWEECFYGLISGKEPDLARSPLLVRINTVGTETINGFCAQNIWGPHQVARMLDQIEIALIKLGLRVGYKSKHRLFWHDGWTYLNYIMHLTWSACGPFEPTVPFWADETLGLIHFWASSSHETQNWDPTKISPHLFDF